MEDLGDLAGLRLLAVLATYRHDGTVLLSPVWHEWREGGFGVVTSSRDVKAAHLRRDHGQASWSASIPAVPRNRGALPRPFRHRGSRRGGTANRLSLPGP